MSEWRILSPEERKLLGDEYITRYARAAGLDAWAAATPEVLDMVNKTPVLNNEFRFRRRVSPVAKNATTQEARCEECNGELSQCGPQGVDGEPSLDCKYCSLKEKLVEAEQRVEKAEAVLKDPAALWVNMLRGTVPMIAEVPNLRRQLEQAEKERDEARRKATALNGVRNQMANAFNASDAKAFWDADDRANSLVEEWTPDLAMALAQRDQLRAEVEEARATAREECKIVCQLRAENERLREALEKDAICSDCLIESKQGHGGCDLRSCGHARLTLGYFVAETNDAFTQQALAAKGETK